MAETIGDRLRELRLNKGWTQEELALHSHGSLEQQTISNIERGIVLKPRRSTLRALADAMDVSVEELTGEEIAPPRYQASVRQELSSYLERLPLEVPVFEQEAAAAMGAGAEPVWHIPIPPFIRPTRRDLFGLTVRGVSLEPDIQDGDVLVVDPDASPSNGRYVVAVHADTVIVKRYVERRGRAFLQGNNGELAMGDVHVLGTVIYRMQQL